MLFWSFFLVSVAFAASSVWPIPVNFSMNSSSSFGLSANFRFLSVGSNSTILSSAFDRYSELLAANSRHVASHSLLTSLDVNVKSTNVSLVFDVNESYELIIGEQGATLNADTVFGALRGLETFSQLAEHDPVHKALPLIVDFGVISDFPRFPYRGLMMDYSRHFYPVPFIKHTIDAMVATKLNILHMHITDDQSFPIESASHPELAAKGSFSYNSPSGPKSYTYNKTDMQDLGQYALERGVLLVPEFDMPAHTASWGAAHPELMVRGPGCSSTMFQHGDTLNPTLNNTYELLDSLLGDLVSQFPPPFLHLGGDEVPVNCWAGNSDVNQWMAAHGFKKGDYNSLESYFVNRVASGEAVKESGRILMYWEEVFNNGVQLPPDSIIQAWKSNAMPGVLKAGHRVTNSFKWYLNHGCNNFGDGNWQLFYLNDPIQWANTTDPAMLKNIMGGETTMWAECVDAVSFDSIVWPRAAAAAEQLWSPRQKTKSTEVETATRLSMFRCALVGRGVRAAPIADDLPYSPRVVNAGCQ